MIRLIIAFLLLSVSAKSQDLLFKSQEIASMVITVDFKRLFIKGNDTAMVPGALKYTLDNQIFEDACKLRKRGVARQNPDVCKFPPLLIRFDSLPANSLFWPNKKLKLVTHCQTGIEYYEQYLILEYLIYKMYNLFTDYSFRVRLVQMDYMDTHNKADSIRKLAFFIEDQNLMASRLGATLIDDEKVHQEWTERERMTITSLFQFMIGNVDWAVPGQHNIKLLKITDHKNMVVVPYDFDCSGFINPPYASANETLGQQSVKQRIFRGYFRTDEELEEAFKVFREKRQCIDSLISIQPFLNIRYKRKALDYINEFYDIINTPKQVEKKIKRSFRK